MAKRTQQFQTIRTEGAILPPDILRRIASLKVEGATPDAYHLRPGAKLNEAISQSWTSLLNHWRAFQEAREKLPESDETGTAVTNERWLLPLFKELDYGRLLTGKAPQIDDRTYPIERFYNHTPIHLIGCKLPPDRRTKGARGAATASPHSMLQEFLNTSDQHIWAFLSNGLQLRILRDNVSLSRQTFVEFDLEAMMEGEVYADFALLWLLCHQSRVEAEKPDECWLEKWSTLARQQGTRILNDLRLGVAKAIEALGRGFIGHARNDALREKLRTGALPKEHYYRQLLRIVYRLLFLFVAEDRELLHPKDAAEAECGLYDAHYSTRRLRELAHKIRGSKHSDLWHSLSLVFAALGKNEGCKELGLCALGSFLWRGSSTPDLLGPHQANGEAVLITNDDLLLAVRELAYVEQDRVLRQVDYRNLGSEELGSVYESLLELHPALNADAKSFELFTAAGNERKTTGSYYTPDTLVQCLLDSALDQVVEDRLKGKKGTEAERAILDLKVCDPACGSGHFLISAAHRLARHLARIRTGESEPNPEDYQHALRDVIGRCVYGVDLNPMAVELCKVSLWMEAIEPGRPLSFLDHHIQCGNSLLGVTPALLARGIPDEGFLSIEGDVNRVCNQLKKDNKRQRADYASGQGYLFAPQLKLGNLPAMVSEINLADDESVEAVESKQALYERLVQGADYRNAHLLADTWCAAFVWKKDNTDLGQHCPTERDFRGIENNPHSILPHVQAEVRRLAEQYQFFHWHLTYPDVFRLPSEDQTPENEQMGWDGGFDVVLGNPPWERLKLQETEWFTSRDEVIAETTNAATRRAKIAALETESPELFAEFLRARRHVEGQSHLVRNSARFPLCGCGDVNTYALFTEWNLSIASRGGRIGCVVPSGIATDDTYKQFFLHLMQRGHLLSLLSFFEIRLIFTDTDSRNPFCLLTLTADNRGPTANAVFVFFAKSIGELHHEERQFTLTSMELPLLNPNTMTCPVFRDGRDKELAARIYTRFPILSNDNAVPNGTWGITIRRVFDMNKSDVRDACQPWEDAPARDDRAPVFEAKMLSHYDHRFASYQGGDINSVAHASKANPDFVARPRYCVPYTEVERRIGKLWSRQWTLSWRDITNATNERTMIGSILPAPSGDFTVRLAFVDDENAAVAGRLLTNVNSFVLDYCVRQKQGGNHLSDYIVKQLPVITPTSYTAACAWRLENELGTWLDHRLLELTYTAWNLEPFALDCGCDGPPFRWDDTRRFHLRCELDAAYFHLYLGPPEEWCADSPRLAKVFPTPRGAVEYIMETFPIVKRKDVTRTEVKNDTGDVIGEGRYVTKDTILEIYDEMSEAIRSGKPYRTQLDPPPGPPTTPDGSFIPVRDWDRENWPRHIHLPRPEPLDYGDVVADILLLLDEWKSAVSILALEPAVLLMQNEQARNAFLGRARTPSAERTTTPAQKIIEGIDLVYRGLEVNGAIEAVGKNGYRLLKPELVAGLSADNRRRAKQVVEAIKVLSRPEDAHAIVAQVTHERYAVAIP